MKWSLSFWKATLGVFVCAAAIQAEEPLPLPQHFDPAAEHVLTEAIEFAEPRCDCGQPVCGCEAPPAAPPMLCDSGCDSLLPSGPHSWFGSRLGQCCLGDPFSLVGQRWGWNIGGFVQLGYHTQQAGNRFNTRPDEVQLQQGWLWAEKLANGKCGLDFGGRIDYVYGTDGQDTQARGDNSGWDTGWDNGRDYGHALPQAYGEVAYGDLAVKVGHFYTLLGWEVVPATDNFFYSHTYTMYNSQPFTHTGALASWAADETVSLYGGYTLGWDSGFNDNGDSFLGAVRIGVVEDVELTYATTFGRFHEGLLGVRGLNERGYLQSVIVNTTLTDQLQYVLHTDFVKTHDQADIVVRDGFSLNHYLIYTINDCLSAGARFEWYNVESFARPGGVGDNNDIYDLTLGMNYRPHANLVIRPEVRWDWSKDGDGLFLGNPLSAAAAGRGVPVGTTINENGDASQTTFGIDAIVTF